MFRSDSWMQGHYIDNHKKFECQNCEKEFILGEKLLEDCPPGFPVCPYCGQSNVECMSCTEDDQLEELAAEMGCLAIYVDYECPVCKNDELKPGQKYCQICGTMLNRTGRREV